MAALKYKLLLFSMLILAQVFSDELEGGFEEDINSFGFELYRSLAKEPGDILFSPYSISCALAMFSLGARGNTLQEIYEALNFANRTSSSINSWFDSKNKIQPSGNEGITLDIANRLFAAKGLKISENYLQSVGRIFNVSLDQLDFSDPKRASEYINKWISSTTKNKLTELTKSSDFDYNTKLVSANAVYFKGDWKEAFDRKATKLQEFILNKISSTKKRMMNKYSFYNYAYMQKLKVRVLELPYKGDQFSMLILLPHKGIRLHDVEHKIDTSSLTSLKFIELPINVSLPKFEMEMTYKLEDDLKKLGLETLFDASGDLTGISEEAGLAVSKGIHKAFVQVAEEGASDVTDIMTNSNFIYLANNPFMFLIRENENNLIYLLGRFSGQRRF